MDIYSEQDNKGRERFKQFCKRKQWCKHHKDAIKQYSHWDIAYYSGNTMILAEIKEREYASTAFSDWWGEMYKYNELMALKDKLKLQGKDVKVHYINLFTNDDVIIWELDNIQLDTFKMDLNATTLEDNGTRNKAMYRLWKAQSIVWEPITIKPLLKNIDEDIDDNLPF